MFQILNASTKKLASTLIQQLTLAYQDTTFLSFSKLHNSRSFQWITLVTLSLFHLLHNTIDIVETDNFRIHFISCSLWTTPDLVLKSFCFFFPFQESFFKLISLFFLTITISNTLLDCCSNVFHNILLLTQFFIQKQNF